MRPPASIAAWFGSDKMERWGHDAPSKESYRRPLAVWWNLQGPHAHEVADLLMSSNLTVRHWTRQFTHGYDRVRLFGGVPPRKSRTPRDPYECPWSTS